MFWDLLGMSFWSICFGLYWWSNQETEEQAEKREKQKLEVLLSETIIYSCVETKEVVGVRYLRAPWRIQDIRERFDKGMTREELYTMCGEQQFHIHIMTMAQEEFKLHER